MPIIDSKYSIGIDEMDAQHARLINIIEEFRSVGSHRIVEQPGINAATRALEELLQYTRTHFASEEQFMAAHKYPDLDTHKKQHGELEASVLNLLNEIREYKTSSGPLKLNIFVAGWLVEHILQEDNKYARFVLGGRRR